MTSKIMMNPSFDMAGSSQNPALILIHGAIVSRKMWLPQLFGLSDTYHVIAPDLCGHGALSHIPFTFAAAEQAIAELIDREAGGRALIAGLSLGGYVAIKLGENYPDLVAGLVLSGCSHNFRGVLGLYLKVLSALMQNGWLKQSRSQAEQKVREMFSPVLSDVAEAQIQAGVFPEALGASFSEMVGVDFASSLANFYGPGLILNGERDKASRRGEKQFASVMPRGQLQIIPDAGHACSLDQPETYNRAVKAFGQSIGWITKGADIFKD
jgi:pimeloyl-ACP methyl ester carboxylesterase